MKKEKENIVMPETEEGTVLFNVPFPKDLKQLKDMSPIVILQHYGINYIHSYGQDSPYFAGLANGRLLGTKCTSCGYVHVAPKFHCQECGSECEWIELPKEGKIHTFTVCHFGSEEFLKETPFMLVLVEFEGAKTLMLSRLLGVDPAKVSLNLIGKKVRPRFKRNSKFKPTDVYFVLAE